MAEHIGPWKTYLWVWLALMGLMALTAGLSYVDLGEWSTIVALTIAVIKAVLVVLVFMHVKYEGLGMTSVVVVGGFFWLGILLLLSLTDYLTREVTGWPGH
jgi:cytochrome c oxidase subunit 4